MNVRITCSLILNNNILIGKSLTNRQPFIKFVVQTFPSSNLCAIWWLYQESFAGNNFKLTVAIGTREKTQSKCYLSS